MKLFVFFPDLVPPALCRLCCFMCLPFFRLPLFIFYRPGKLWILPVFRYNTEQRIRLTTRAFTAFLTSMVPVIVTECLCQERFISSLTVGTVKK